MSEFIQMLSKLLFLFIFYLFFFKCHLSLFSVSYDTLNWHRHSRHIWMSTLDGSVGIIILNKMQLTFCFLVFWSHHVLEYAPKGLKWILDVDERNKFD
jgi:hypothetical protein